VPVIRPRVLHGATCAMRDTFRVSFEFFLGFFGGAACHGLIGSGSFTSFVTSYAFDEGGSLVHAFSASARVLYRIDGVTRGFWPVISARTMIVASMKIHGQGYGCRKFPGRIDADKCGELTAQEFKQLLHLPDVGLPVPIILAKLEHARGGRPLLA